MGGVGRVQLGVVSRALSVVLFVALVLLSPLLYDLTG
jgi:hypothetical protein